MGIFRKREESLVEYIKVCYSKKLEEKELSDIDLYVNDYLDLDRYKQKTLLFFNFGSYDITPLTNESGTGQFAFDVFLVFRGDTPENLHNKMLEYADAFYEVFEESDFNFGQAIDGTMDVAADFYNAAEGNPNCKVCAMTFTTTSEM